MSPEIRALVQIEGGRWLLLESPAVIIEASHLSDVPAALADVERLTRDAGYHAAGYVSYEAGGAFGLSVRLQPDESPPLAWFALFEPRTVRELDAPPSGGAYEL
jgi:para-aminobenzoate synthetase/4-amino-4-deoxychorismate lyase